MPSVCRSNPGRLFTAVLGLVLACAARAQEKPVVDKDHAEKMARGLEVFKKHVRPVLEKCLRCHGGKTTESEFDLHDRDVLLKGGIAGPAVVPGKAKDSLLYKLVTHQKEPHMPEGGKKLPDDTIAQIAQWIDLGAPYDRPLLDKGTTAAWTRTVVPASAKQHWSYQPLGRVEPPAVRNGTWPRTTVDRFVLARLETAGIEPGPPVDRRRLIRRAHLDLVGLPPTPEEVDAFLKDTSADAFARVVDRLLASPRYGERWGRHWLDLARFAESHGFEHDYDRPTAYHYRDFVIQALNEDLPFDNFARWQLAGDELAADNPLALKATGFLAAGVHSTQITKREVEKHRYDELDDMLATTSTAFLGLTIGCARCHDHKFDAIPQADYYRLLSAFTTTVRSEIELPVDQASYAEEKAAFDSRHAPLLMALERFEADQLPGRFAAWEKQQKERGGPRLPSPWVAPQMTAAKSAGGAMLAGQPDGSYLAGGKNPPNDTFTFTAQTSLEGITAVRLEALSHPSLVKGGPGRATNGNFALTTFEVTVAPKDGKGKAVPVKLTDAVATFEQAGLPARAAIDADARSGWAVDPQFGKDHAVTFRADRPFGFPGGSVLTFTLHFKNNTQHAIGRPRLSLTTSAEASLTGAPITETVVAALGIPAEKRSAEQKTAVLRWYATIDPEWVRLNSAILEHKKKEPQPRKVKVLISSEGLPPVRLHSQGEDFFKETHYLRRGDPDQKQGVANQGYLQVLLDAPEKAARWKAGPPPGARTSFRRTALANWITDVEHGAGHLLARVIVNRLWQLHLGRGIVATPSDFGTRGEKPTHPELLDWLAGELIRGGWKLKPIHKLIMTSAVYAQESRLDPARAAKDRDNRLFWRRLPMRLEAEAVRDSLLSLGGLLDPAMYGPGTLDENSRRRSIYFTVKRSKLIPMLQVFDAPDALGGVGERPTTTVAPQALLLMNNPQVRAAARGFAARVGMGSDEESVRRAYETALSRPPRLEELADGVAFVGAQQEAHKTAGKRDARALALADFCQVLLCLNEFIYID